MEVKNTVMTKLVASFCPLMVPQTLQSEAGCFNLGVQAKSWLFSLFGLSAKLEKKNKTRNTSKIWLLFYGVLLSH